MKHSNIIKFLFLYLWIALIPVFGQPGPQSGIRRGAELPTVCLPQSARLFIKEGTGAGVYYCSAINTWSLLGGNGESSGGPATWGSITGTLSSQTDLNSALDLKAEAASVNSSLALKADLASPTFTGAPQAPTAINGTSNTQIATTAFVQTAVSGISGASIWTTVQKSNQTQVKNNSAVLGNDDALTFIVPASTTVSFKFTIFFTTLGAADFKWRLTGSNVPTSVVFTAMQSAAGTAGSVNSYAAFSSADVATLGTGSGGVIIIEGTIQNTSSNCTVNFQWAQNTATAGNTFVMAGSYVEYTAL